ncbi:MAG: hypothetical protein ABWY27_05045, partial [Telluria sp.]
RNERADQHRHENRQAANPRHAMRMDPLHRAEIGIERASVQTDSLDYQQSQQSRTNKAHEERKH